MLLKNLISECWDRESVYFNGHLLEAQDKAAVKSLIPQILNSPHSKLRTAGSMVISTIAGWDWPQNWSSLLDDLVLCLQDNDPFLVCF